MGFLLNVLKLFDRNELDYTPIRRFEVTNRVPKHAHEMMKSINDAKDDQEQQSLIKRYGATPPMNMLLSLNFNQKVLLDFPEGAPPYNRDETTHEDLMTPLATQIGRLKACVKGNNIRKMDKERVLIQILECVPPKDADLLISCKDKALHEVYPNIKPENVKAVFPNYVG